jgi:HSP20 family molecular chaperone IbpA
MSLVSHSFLPRSMLDMDTWFTPTLETFDPFDELDNMLGRNLQWLTRPSFLEPLTPTPRIPRKYRVTVDCTGFQPNSIKTNIEQSNLIVTGKEESKADESGDFSTKEFKKTYKLPSNAEADKLVSFMTRHGKLVVEVPLKAERQHREDLLPIVENNQVRMNCSLPKNIDPSKISVTCKDRDLIIKAEDTVEKGDSVSNVSYYKRCTMPSNTDFDQLKCHFENNQLTVQAPINPAIEAAPAKLIPVEYSKK